MAFQPENQAIRQCPSRADNFNASLLGDIVSSIQSEFSLFRTALQSDLATSNDQLKQYIEQALKGGLTEEKAIHSFDPACLLSTPLYTKSCVGPPSNVETTSSLVKVESAVNSATSIGRSSAANNANSSVTVDGYAGANSNFSNGAAVDGVGAVPTSTGTIPMDMLSSLVVLRGSTQLSEDPVVKKCKAPPRLSWNASHKSNPNQRTFFINTGASMVSMDDLDKPVYDVSMYYHKTGVFRYIAASEWFYNLTMTVICCNSIYLGLDANENKADNLIDAKWYFFLFENFFAIYFTVEWIIRFCAFKHKRDCLKDMWFKFDSALVLLMIFETWLIIAIAGSMTLPTGPLRLFRLLRLARMTRLMRALPELVTMVKGLVYGSRAMGSSVLLLLLLLYVFAIAMHSFLKNTAYLSKYFKTIPRCMWTLLLDGVFMDSTGSLMWVLINKGEILAIIVFLIFILLSSMTVMNMLIGVLCEVVQKVSIAEHEANDIYEVKTTLLVMLKRLDSDGSGDITKDELTGVLSDPEALNVLGGLQVDYTYVMGLMEMLFQEESSTIPIPVIMECILAHRGDKAETVQDAIHCHTYTRWCLTREMEEQTNALKCFFLSRERDGPDRRVATRRESY